MKSASASGQPASQIARHRRFQRAHHFHHPHVEALEQRYMLATFANLDPGGPADLLEEVPVNIVFVGYEPSMINETDFRAWLPTFQDPLVLTKGEEVGLHYTYDYQLTYTDLTFEDAFFQELTSLAVLQFAPANHTYYQELYNQQATNSVEIIQNYLIDAPSVEHWLAANPPAGVDTTENTIFFVNWWGRSDFKFHVYMDNHDPDPDTGFAWGNYEYSARLAFGGTTQADEETGLGSLGTHRIFVHDLSAGPDAMTGNWNVDNAAGRIPPVWDYLNLYPQYLGNDLGALTRFVALDSIFTTSPIYPPYLTFPDLPMSINLDINIYDGWKKADASQTVQPESVRNEVNELFRVPMTVDVQKLKYQGQPQVALESLIKDKPHFKQYGNDNANANLVYQEALNLQDRLDGGGDYEAVAAIYAVDDKTFEGLEGITGVAYTNFQDGTQSFVFAFVAPSYFPYFGATSTLIHEYGHHFGLNHPHEGYDSEFGFYFSGLQPGLEFVFTGTESNSVMSYNLLNNDFSQWDLDNFNRFWAAGYIQAANAIAADILANPHAAAAQTFLAAADAQIGLAQDAVAQHDYPAAFDHALLAYAQIRAGASAAGVTIVGTQIGREVPLRPRGKSGHDLNLLSPLRHSPSASSANAMHLSWAATTMQTRLEERNPERMEGGSRPIDELPPAARGSRRNVEPATVPVVKHRLDGRDLNAKDSSFHPGSSRQNEFDLALLTLLTESESTSVGTRGSKILQVASLDLEV